MSNNVINEVMAIPLGELISSIGKGVGEAQAALDAGSLQQTLALYSKDNLDNTGKNTKLAKLLKEIGYRPTFYALPETEVTTTVSIAISGEGVTDLSILNGQTLAKRILPRLTVYPINAANSNRYNVDIKAATTLNFKIVPVPMPIHIEHLLDNGTIDELLDKIEEAEKK